MFAHPTTFGQHLQPVGGRVAARRVPAGILNARWAVVACLGGVACSGSPPAPPVTSDMASLCAPSPGISGAPSSIADAIALANDLLARHPDGLTIPCFVQSLDRPLGMLAVNSVFSAQPAGGPRSPRTFLFTGNLVMSVVPSGPAVHSVELAEYVLPTRSIKAEIGFPLQAPLTGAQPYDRIRSGNGTWCSGCHLDEAQTDSVTITEAFATNVLRPRPIDVVPLSFVADQASTCDNTVEPERCALLNALLGHGAIEPREFSPDARTIYDN